MTDLICYCFEFSASDIWADLAVNNGRSRILEQITEVKKAGVCRCATLHPEGR